MPSPKEHALDLYMSGIRDGDAQAALERNIGDRYTQHSTGVKDGKDGFLEFFQPFLERNPVREMEVLHALQDGPHVFVHVYQKLNGGEAEWVTMDFFDTDAEGRIVEHWDTIAAYVAETKSGGSTIDGTRDITDLDQTAANRAVVADYIETCFVQQKIERLDDFVADSYTPHSAEVAGGRDGLRTVLTNTKDPLRETENVLLVAEGNFVAALNREVWGDHEFCVADLFRLDGGKIVEHWDNIEPVPPRDTWANSGKF